MTFCGMRTQITPEARQALQQYVVKLYEHMPTLQAVVARAETLLPYIEEALRYIGVPEDLKYLAIQESRLNPYAVSRSGAVGYWQFKDYTAREVGLIINDTIDERKHLFRSSAAAALYLTKQYNRHRNWLFAIIAYYEGGTGAIPYIDTAYVGKDEVCIRANTHWYALRALAHKLVFESLIKKRIYALKPVAYQGPARPAWAIAQEHGISVDTFLLLNPWLVQPILPARRPSTYYLLVREEVPFEAPQEPLKSLFAPNTLPFAIASVPAGLSFPSDTTATADSPAPPEEVSPPPFPLPKEKASPPSLNPSTPAVLSIYKEPYLHHEWAYPPPPLTEKLRRWNPFYEKDAPVLIVPPAKAHIHIVQRGESLREIAAHYGRSLARLQGYNSTANPDSTLPVGLRVYLREARPYDERPILYRWP
jgi:membrane-bound lytic murein transglycosylase D